MFSGLITLRRFPFIGRSDSNADRAPRHPMRRGGFLAVAGLMLLLLTLVPTVAVGAQTAYPPNTVISTYYDARYGEVSVVSDASGNLIDVNAQTGQRIYPVYADYTSGVTYTAPAYVSGSYYNYSGASTYGVGNYILRQYTDNSSNCTNGQVTQTASGYYCTATGTPAYHVA
jgi:hypothetical protein